MVIFSQIFHIKDTPYILIMFTIMFSDAFNKNILYSEKTFFKILTNYPWFHMDKLLSELSKPIYSKLLYEI